MDRRQFLTDAAGALGLLGLAANATAAAPNALRPNILWISCEDICPLLGCYGDSYASTPHLDGLAAEGVRYTRAYAHAPVCAPARSGIITGVYPSTLGSHNMRSKATLPEHIRCFPEYLQQAGYYCSNNAKEDYNFNKPPSSWNDSSKNAHWRTRESGRPFFSVFNITVCHESILHVEGEALAARLKAMKPEQKHDPAKAPIPKYHPDIPEFHEAWARYYDSISSMDAMAGAILQELEDDGLADETIVFFWGDHGTGMPRGKRWIYESGTHIPLIVRFPEKYQHLAPAEPGAAIDRLVSFVDFAPTVLSLTGVAIPTHMQGKAFLGNQDAPARDHVFFTRDRMDEWYDCIRGVRDDRYRYIRNFEAHMPYNQPLSYLYKAPCMQAWGRLAREGKLEGAPALYMRPEKPVEELYDVQADPDEVQNLADAPEHRERLGHMRQVLFDWMVETRDLGLVPEAEIHRQRGDMPELTWGQHIPEASYRRVLETADLPRRGDDSLSMLRDRLDDSDPVVRFWAASGLGVLRPSEPAAKEILEGALCDNNPNVALAAAFALHRLGDDASARPAILRYVEHDAPWVRLYALNMVSRTRGSIVPERDVLDRLTHDANDYVTRAARILLGQKP